MLRVDREGREDTRLLYSRGSWVPGEGQEDRTVLASVVHIGSWHSACCLQCELRGWLEMPRGVRLSGTSISRQAAQSCCCWKETPKTL